MNTTSIDSFDNSEYFSFTTPARVERDMQVLIGIISGIVCDKVINQAEKKQLHGWLTAMQRHTGRKPYKDIIEVVKQALEDNVLTPEEKENILWLCSKFTEERPYFNQFTRDLQQLSGVIFGIIADGEINEEEVSYLDSWLEAHRHLQNCWPYDELYHFITLVLADGKVTADEKAQLLNFFDAISDNAADTNESLMRLFDQNFYQIDPTIVFEAQNFCITGISQKYKRRQIADAIAQKGGFVLENVSSKINYLVVCSDKNQCWAYSAYGRKIEEAMKLRKEGRQLAIIHEFDLYDVME